jgi:hypothetical protein
LLAPRRCSSSPWTPFVIRLGLLIAALLYLATVAFILVRGGCRCDSCVAKRKSKARAGRAHLPFWGSWSRRN